MLEAFSGNAIAAKARAIYGKRLTTANYNDLLRLSSVSDVCAYLKNNTNYGIYMKGVNETSIHRGQLEDIIRHSRIEEYFSLCHFDFTKKKGFYYYVISSVEVSLILKVIMFLNANTPRDIIAQLPSFLDGYATFDFRLLATVKNYSDLLDILKRTPYYDAIKSFDAPNGEINFSSCEHALKTLYYQSIFNDIEKLYKGKVKEQLKEIVTIEIELLNLSLIYRLKRHFKKSPEEIKPLLLPFYHKINKRSLEDL
ncbi:MAG: V-type ATPase subunit, partial [Oscillospiraceae bacterium]